MSKKKFAAKSTIKPFAKYVNYNHMLPTRFMVKDDMDFRNIVTDEKMANPEARKAAKQELRKMLEQR